MIDLGGVSGKSQEPSTLPPSSPHAPTTWPKGPPREMKKLLLVFLIAASLCADESRPVIGRQYREWTDFVRAGYVAGYISGYAKATGTFRRRIREALQAQGIKEVPVTNGTGEPFCPADLFNTIDFGQGRAILDKYLADHPERWDKPIHDLAEEAFIEACEKRAKKP
jgi:hypothetical protein